MTFSVQAPNGSNIFAVPVESVCAGKVSTSPTVAPLTGSRVVLGQPLVACTATTVARKPDRNRWTGHRERCPADNPEPVWPGFVGVGAGRRPLLGALARMPGRHRCNHRSKRRARRCTAMSSTCGWEALEKLLVYVVFVSSELYTVKAVSLAGA